MTLPAEAVTNVNLSYGRCSMSPGFFDTFYDIFLKSSPIIAPMFANTDFSKQKSLLKGGITFVLMYAKDPAAAFPKGKLEAIGDIHNRARVNVAPNMYPFWIDSLMQAVKQHDKDYTPELEKQWRAVIKPAIDLMVTHY